MKLKMKLKMKNENEKWLLRTIVHLKSWRIDVHAVRSPVSCVASIIVTAATVRGKNK